MFRGIPKNTPTYIKRIYIFLTYFILIQLIDTPLKKKKNNETKLNKTKNKNKKQQKTRQKQNNLSASCCAVGSKTAS